MTVQQLCIMHELMKRGTMIAAQISDTCFFAPASCTRMLAEMVESGLISCEPMKFDKRIKLYELKEAGRQIVKNAEQKAESDGHLLGKTLKMWTNDRRRLSKGRQMVAGWL